MYRINTWTSSTRTYNREHAQIIKDGFVVGEGVYKWQNRPWQKYTFDKALQHALVECGQDLSKFEECSSVDDVLEILNQVECAYCGGFSHIDDCGVFNGKVICDACVGDLDEEAYQDFLKQ